MLQTLLRKGDSDLKMVPKAAILSSTESVPAFGLAVASATVVMMVVEVKNAMRDQACARNPSLA